MDVNFFLKETAADAVVRDFLTRDMQAARLSPKFRAYYRLRPFIPLGLRQRLQKGRKVKVDEDWYLPAEFMRALVRAVQERGEPFNVIHPWPGGASFAFVLTHDIETRDGLRNVEKIADMEEELGFRSSWNVVPYKYPVDAGWLKELQARGFEIGIHGYNHDGRLFWSKHTFEQRAVAVNVALHKFGAVGFRSPMVHRNLQWLQRLDIQYDASCFDIDPYQAMPGGVGSIWPFVAGKFVELPYTLPQDHTLFVARGEQDCRIWHQKLKFVAGHSGMALMLTHPDYLASAKYFELYRQFLIEVQEQGEYWHALPKEVVRWWNEREQSGVQVNRIGQPMVVGPVVNRGRCVSVTVQSGKLRFCTEEEAEQPSASVR